MTRRQLSLALLWVDFALLAAAVLAGLFARLVPHFGLDPASVFRSASTAAKACTALLGATILQCLVAMVATPRKAKAKEEPPAGGRVLGDWPIALAGLAFAFSFAAVALNADAAQNAQLEMAQRLVLDGDTLRLDGAIAKSLPSRLRKLYASGAHPNRLVLGANHGGDVEAMLEAAKILQGHQVTDARVTGPCDSACAFLALLLPQRHLAPGGALGFHDVRKSINGDRKAAEDSRQRLHASMRAAGYSDNLVDELLANDQVQYPARAELQRRLLITGCIDDAGQATPCVN
jgi:hypothetical protein